LFVGPVNYAFIPIMLKVAPDMNADIQIVDTLCSSKISISIFPRVNLIPNDLAIKQDINNIQIPKVETPEENKSLYYRHE
jgi:hypothetical protein